ncbi:MAG: Rrf2 family transcriptional regulator [Bacteroides sp.]|nr:Rrf2 family transcriptional regulator [Eubacterium sp.]MCM1419268.1 Rrf2 family transcriptional regulator [Roseburia sp.]MCM1461383.1 Rrf2 family transcriptional regulator [Bacteroides sp.]
MKISTKGRYALRMLVDLAARGGEYTALRDIAAREHISKKYLEQIVPLLHAAGIIQTGRGVRGGYRLSAPPERFSVGDILRATEGSLAPVSCLERGAPECERRGECMTLAVWRGLARVMNDYLDRITLKDVLEGRIP